MGTAANPPNIAKGILMIATTMNIQRHAGNEPLPWREVRRPAWIHPPAMFPRLPKPQNIAARVPSSDCVYQEP